MINNIETEFKKDKGNNYYLIFEKEKINSQELKHYLIQLKNKLLKMNKMI